MASIEVAMRVLAMNKSFLTGLEKKESLTTICSNDGCNGLLQWSADGSDYQHLSPVIAEVNAVNEACFIVLNDMIHDAPCDFSGLQPICMIEN